MTLLFCNRKLCDISNKYIGIDVYFVTEMYDISVKCVNVEYSLNT